MPPNVFMVVHFHGGAPDISPAPPGGADRRCCQTCQSASRIREHVPHPPCTCRRSPSREQGHRLPPSSAATLNTSRILCSVLPLKPMRPSSICVARSRCPTTLIVEGLRVCQGADYVSPAKTSDSSSKGWSASTTKHIRSRSSAFVESRSSEIDPEARTEKFRTTSPPLWTPAFEALLPAHRATMQAKGLIVYRQGQLSEARRQGAPLVRRLRARGAWTPLIHRDAPARYRRTMIREPRRLCRPARRGGPRPVRHRLLGDGAMCTRARCSSNMLERCPIPATRKAGTPTYTDPSTV